MPSSQSVGLLSLASVSVTIYSKCNLKLYGVGIQSNILGRWVSGKRVRASVSRTNSLSSSSVSSLMTKTEIDLETSVYSPFNLLTRLPAPEYFIEFIANLR